MGNGIYFKIAGWNNSKPVNNIKNLTGVKMISTAILK
jgi:hypothetical protein